MVAVGSEDPSEQAIENDDEILARITRRIRSSMANPSRNHLRGPYLQSVPEEFWNRKLDDLVRDGLGLGLVRMNGLGDFKNVLGSVFSVTSPLLMGYIQVAGHVNNLALTRWMPTSRRTAPKVQALVQLHARSLVLLEETYALTFLGFPSGASALSRTLHEVRVTARFLQRFEAQLSERYLASHIIELWKHKDDFAPVGSLRRGRQWKNLERELDDRYSEVIAKFGTSMTIENGWAWPRFSRGRPGARQPHRIPFASLEAEVGLPYDRQRYRAGSRLVHASRLGNIQTLRGMRPDEALLGPRPFGLAGPANQAAWDTQAVAESLLRSCGHLTEGNGEIYYWLEALDQLSHVLRGSVNHAQEGLNEVFAEDESGT